MFGTGTKTRYTPQLKYTCLEPWTRIALLVRCIALSRNSSTSNMPPARQYRYTAFLLHECYGETPVEITNIEIVGGAALLILGLGIGLLLGRRTSSQSQKNREVERKLDQILQDKKAYENEVVEHFTDTAKLLNSLTESYREVHNHLAKGASELCQGQGPVVMDRLENGGDPAEIPAQLADIQPPLDYAPKTSPDEKGMLNESFGLEKEKPEQAAQEPERV